MPRYELELLRTYDLEGFERISNRSKLGKMLPHIYSTDSFIAFFLSLRKDRSPTGAQAIAIMNEELGKTLISAHNMRVAKHTFNLDLPALEKELKRLNSTESKLTAKAITTNEKIEEMASQLKKSTHGIIAKAYLKSEATKVDASIKEILKKTSSLDLYMEEIKRLVAVKDEKIYKKYFGELEDAAKGLKEMVGQGYEFGVAVRENVIATAAKVNDKMPELMEELYSGTKAVAAEKTIDRILASPITITLKDMDTIERLVKDSALYYKHFGALEIAIVGRTDQENDAGYYCKKILDTNNTIKQLKVFLATKQKTESKKDPSYNTYARVLPSILNLAAAVCGGSMQARTPAIIKPTYHIRSLLGKKVIPKDIKEKLGNTIKIIEALDQELTQQKETLTATPETSNLAELKQQLSAMEKSIQALQAAKLDATMPQINKISSSLRSMTSRKIYLEQKIANITKKQSATTIQKIGRGFLGRKKFKEQDAQAAVNNPKSMWEKFLIIVYKLTSYIQSMFKQDSSNERPPEIIGGHSSPKESKEISTSNPGSLYTINTQAQKKEQAPEDKQTPGTS